MWLMRNYKLPLSVCVSGPGGVPASLAKLSLQLFSSTIIRSVSRRRKNMGEMRSA